MAMEAHVTTGGDRSKSSTTQFRRARQRFASALAAFLAVLALVGQLAAAPHRHPMASALPPAAAALAAAVGANVALCDHSDSAAPGSPSRDRSDCDNCPLCQTSGAAAAVAPPAQAFPTPAAHDAAPPRIPESASVAKPRFAAFAQPRAPPRPS
jgi:hypothetical protein